MKKYIKQNQVWGGIAGILLGIYMIYLNDVRGTIPLIIGMGLLLWKFK